MLIYTIIYYVSHVYLTDVLALKILARQPSLLAYKLALTLAGMQVCSCTVVTLFTACVISYFYKSCWIFTKQFELPPPSHPPPKGIN